MKLIQNEIVCYVDRIKKIQKNIGHVHLDHI